MEILFNTNGGQTKMRIYKKTETIGCEMEDGADTRETTTEFIIIKPEDEEDFAESIAEDYGSQDYSYSVNYKLVCECSEEEYKEFVKAILEALEHEKEDKQ